MPLLVFICTNWYTCVCMWVCAYAFGRACVYVVLVGQWTGFEGPCVKIDRLCSQRSGCQARGDGHSREDLVRGAESPGSVADGWLHAFPSRIPLHSLYLLSQVNQCPLNTGHLKKPIWIGAGSKEENLRMSSCPGPALPPQAQDLVLSDGAVSWLGELGGPQRGRLLLDLGEWPGSPSSQAWESCGRALSDECVRPTAAAQPVLPPPLPSREQHRFRPPMPVTELMSPWLIPPRAHSEGPQLNYLST